MKLGPVAIGTMIVPGLLMSCAVRTARADTEPPVKAGAVAEAPSPLVADLDFHIPDPQLSGLITVLLEENPDIASARSDWRSTLERVPQERSLPDPMVSYRYFGQSPETRVGPQEHALEISQTLPWFGKRNLQAERAGHLASGASWRARDLERDLIARLKRAYFDVAYLQEALALNADEVALLRRFEEIALTRYAVGEGIQQSVVKVQTDISRLSDRETLLRERLEAATRRIAQLIGKPHSGLSLQPIGLELLNLDLDPKELERQAVGSHPEVHASLRQIEADEAWLSRRNLESRPDFRFGIAYTSVGAREDAPGRASPPPDNGEDSLAFTVGLNVPLYRGRIRAGAHEARQRVRSSERLLQSTRDRLRFEVQEAVLRLESLESRGRLYKDVIIPQAEESLGSAEAAYTTNRQDFLDLLDAERVLFQVRLSYHRLLADYWMALADLERALGQRFPGEEAARTTEARKRSDTARRGRS
jgi:outer membrane protein TolC